MEADEQPPPMHRYPTRSKRARHSPHSCLSQGRTSKRKKEERPRSFIDLPKEITFNILILLPAEVLHEVVRKVCKQWDDIVNDSIFIRAHCRMSTSCARFLVQDSNKQLEVYYVEADNTQSVKITQIEFPSPAIISGSYNGLVLLTDLKNTEALHVINLVTKVKVSLSRSRPLNSYFVRDNLAVNSSGRFKAVSVYGDISYEKMQMSVFTVGVDKAWRCVEIQGMQAMNQQARIALLNSAIFVAGFMYWWSFTGLFCFAMDVDTETIYQFSGPAGLNVFTSPVYPISLGTGLGVMKEEDNERGIWRLWKLTDVKSSKWTEMGKIDIGVMASKVDEGAYDSLGVIPVSLIDGEFRFKYRDISREFFRVVRYNLANKSFVSFRVRVLLEKAYVYPHVPTLLSPRNS